MGHLHSGYFTSDTKEGAERQILGWGEANYDRRETSHGFNGVIWKNHVCESADEAQHYLDQFVDDAYWSCMGVGVAFKQAKKLPKQTKQYQKAVEMLNKYQEKLRLSQSKLHYRNTKQKATSCRFCGRRFNTVELMTNYCPACRRDMRPDTILKQEEDFRTQINYYYNRIQAFENEARERAYKNKDNVKIMYMTTGSIHC